MALVRTDVSEEYIVSIMREKIISELGTTLTVTRNRIVFHRSVRLFLVTANIIASSPILVTPMMVVAQRSSETSDLTSATQHNISEEGNLQIVSNLIYCLNN
jgi:hypothetical protein